MTYICGLRMAELLSKVIEKGSEIAYVKPPVYQVPTPGRTAGCSLPRTVAATTHKLGSSVVGCRINKIMMSGRVSK